MICRLPKSRLLDALSPLRQVAALPLRFDARAEILLVTSRDAKRWVIPKGWPMPGLSDADAAAVEAREEAGLAGVIHPAPLGAYVYRKRRDRRVRLIKVTVYRLDVRRQLGKFRERGQRSARWMSLPEAAEAVREPGLKALLRTLDGRLSDAA